MSAPTTLDLDGATLAGLLARIDHAAGGTVDGDDLALLTTDRARAVGILDGDAAAPALEPSLDTIAAPWARGAVTVRTPSGELEHRTWIGPRASVLAVDGGDGRYALRAATPTAAPAEIFRAAALGPRRGELSPADGVAVGEESIGSLAEDGDPSALAGATHGVLADQLRSGLWRLVLVQCEWSPALLGGEVQHELLLVLDTRAGLVSVTPGGSGYDLVPTSAAALWPRVVGMTLPPGGADLDGEYARLTRKPLGLRF